MVNEAHVLLYLPTYVDMTMKYYDKLNVLLVKFSQQKYYILGAVWDEQLARTRNLQFLLCFIYFFYLNLKFLA